MAKLILALLLICSLVGAGFWYWTSTPQYSLKKLSDAVHQQDLPSFQNYFDINAVSNHAVEDLSSAELRDLGGTSSLRRFIGLTILGLLKPEAANALSNSIANYVQKKPDDPNSIPTDVSATERLPDPEPPRHEGFFARAVKGIVNKVVEAVRPPSLREVLHEAGITKENYRGLSNFEVKDSICHVSLRFQPPDKPEILVELELEKLEDHWHVIRLSNLANLAHSVS